MGTCSSAPQSTQRNNEINQILLKDKKALARTIQVLLLGAGESGKSTFLKQMRILFKNGIPNHEIPFFRKTIHSNILVAIYSLCVAASDLGFSLLPENQLRAVFFSELITEEGADYVFDQEMGEDISALWDDPSIQLAFAESHRFQLSDSTTYFMEKLASISSPDYVPSLDDILHSRSKTVGICETGFDVQGTHFKMVCSSLFFLFCFFLFVCLFLLLFERRDPAFQCCNICPLSIRSMLGVNVQKDPSGSIVLKG